MDRTKISADLANPKTTGLGLVSSLRRCGDNRARMAGKMLATVLPGSAGVSGDGKIMTAMDAAKNISLPEPLLAEIQIAAQAGYRTIDEMLTDAVKRYVEERSWTRLLDYGTERAKAQGVEESDIDRLIAESRAEQRSH